MPSPTNIVRSALQTWVQGLGLVPDPEVVVDPQAGDAVTYPSVAVWVGSAPMEWNLGAEVVDEALGALELGTVDAPVAIRWRAAENHQADDLAAAFRGLFYEAARGSNEGGEAVLHFTVTIAGHPCTAKLYLTGEAQLPPNEDKQLRDYHVLNTPGRVVFPWLFAESDPTGTMTISVNICGTEYFVPPYP